MFGATKTAIFGFADPVVFETAMLVVVFGTAEPVVFSFQVQLLHGFEHCHTARTSTLHMCLQHIFSFYTF